MTTAPPAVVIGAGLTGRGLVPQLLGPAHPLLYVDLNEELVEEINARGRFTIEIVGSPPVSMTVTSIAATVPSRLQHEQLRGISWIFVAVGDAGLDDALDRLIAVLAEGEAPVHPINVVLCENIPDAAQRARAIAGKTLPPATLGRVGMVQAVVLTSSFPAREPDVLDLRSERHSTLIIDGTAALPFEPLPGITVTEDIAATFTRKLYTYNSINAVLGYLGWHRGCRTLPEAAADPNVAAVAMDAYREMNEALIRRYGGAREQDELAAASWRKFSEPSLADPLLRQIRDPMRKLGAGERLVGAATLALEEGVQPVAVSTAIAAALYCTEPRDPEALLLSRLVADRGWQAALELTGGVGPGSPLIPLVGRGVDAVQRLTALPGGRQDVIT